MNELRNPRLMLLTALLSSLISGAVVLSLLIFTGLLNIYESGVISVREIRLVNEHGQECGKISAREDRSGYIQLGGFGLPHVGAQFWVEASPYKHRDGGQVQLYMGDAGGSMMLTSGPYGNAGPLLYMVNGQNKIALATGVWGKDGEGYLRIDDYDPAQKGVPGAKHVMDKVAGSSLMVVDNEGKVTWAAPNAK